MARPKKSDLVDTTQAIELTAGAIERLTCRSDIKAQVFLRDSKAPGLRVRATNTGAKSFVYEAKLNRQTIRRTIGDVRSWSIDQARAEARRLAVVLDNGQDPRELERQQLAEREAQRQRLEAEARTAAQAQKFTLQALCNEYATHLEAMGRTSHRDVRSIFNLHITEAWPDLALTPANQVTDEQVADMMRSLIEKGKGRTANKLRSYLRAAYATAKGAKTTPATPLIFKSFDVRNNPAAETSPDKTANKADKNPLNMSDLRTYWQLIRDMEGFQGAVLRLHLLTGGQRIEQLVKLLTKDVHEHHIVLMDGKGRPGKEPRPHAVPLLPEAKAALDALQPAGNYAISTAGGKTHVHATTFSGWAKEAAMDLQDFDAKRIRSGVETALAAYGVSMETRGRLQSHGISGVQNRHYDGYDYMAEKRHALETLMHLLNATDSAKVVPIKAA